MCLDPSFDLISPQRVVRLLPLGFMNRDQMIKPGTAEGEEVGDTLTEIVVPDSYSGFVRLLLFLYTGEQYFDLLMSAVHASGKFKSHGRHIHRCRGSTRGIVPHKRVTSKIDQESPRYPFLQSLETFDPRRRPARGQCGVRYR